MPGTIAQDPPLVAPAVEIKVEQGSDEWLELRLGLATASEFKNIMTTIRSGESAARRNYRAQLVAERLTGKMAERFKSNAMQWGNDMEELAATTVALQTGLSPEVCGFFRHNTEMIGDSPDRLIGRDGCMEIKCYELANHIAALRSGQMPKEHMAQVQGHMWMTGRAWCLFTSFAPELPESAQLFLQVVQRDEVYIARMEVEILSFLREVDDEVEFIKNYKNPEFVL